MKRIKDEEREKGKQEALSALAQAAGYESHTDLVAVLASLKAGGGGRQQEAPPEPPAQPPRTPAQPPGQGQGTPEDPIAARNAQREVARFERQAEKLTRERDSFAQKYAVEAQRSHELQDALDAKDAEMALRETAVACGIKDVDYALRLLTRELENKKEDEMAGFDERAFFDGLRKTKPYLYGETVQSATTGTGTGAAPMPPKPGAVAAGTAAGSQPDARKMNPQEYQEHLRKRNLHPNQ